MNQSSNILSISYETLRKVARRLDRYELDRRRWGRTYAENKRAPRSAGVRTTRPLERVEMDNFLVDVHLLVRTPNGFIVQRPWLTVAVDHYSGVILGYHLSLAPPSASSLLAALRTAILPQDFQTPEENPIRNIVDRLAAIDQMGKPQMSEEVPRLKPIVAALRSLREPPPIFGIPDYACVDNGPDYVGRGFMDACFNLGIEILYAPPRMAWIKAIIERVGRTLNTRLFHWLPGTTLGKWLKDHQYDPQKDALILYEDFERLLAFYVYYIHNYTPIQKKGKPPIDRWMAGIAQYPPRVPESAEAFDAGLALTYPVTVTQQGIAFSSLYYNNPELGALWNRLEKPTRKRRVNIKVNPLDITRIFVIDPRTDEPFAVPCTTAFEYPPVLDYHEKVVAWVREQGKDPENARNRSMGHAALHAGMEEAAARGRRALRKKEAELARRVENYSASPFAQASIQNNSRDELDDLLRASREGGQ